MSVFTKCVLFKDELSTRVENIRKHGAEDTRVTKQKQLGCGENYVIRNFIIYTLRQILLR
jgi:hypothetical protein